jgi:ribonuclease VapC
LIVVDSSALIAIFKGEIEAPIFRSALSQAALAVMAAPTKIEFMMVAGGRFGQDGLVAAQALLESSGIAVQDWTEVLSNRAVEAFMRYGKGRHPAKLNFGDCMSYALAKSLNAPLLYKGDNFAKTDIKSAAAASA